MRTPAEWWKARYLAIRNAPEGTFPHGAATEALTEWLKAAEKGADVDAFIEAHEANGVHALNTSDGTDLLIAEIRRLREGLK